MKILPILNKIIFSILFLSPINLLASAFETIHPPSASSSTPTKTNSSSQTKTFSHKKIPQISITYASKILIITTSTPKTSSSNHPSSPPTPTTLSPSKLTHSLKAPSNSTVTSSPSQTPSPSNPNLSPKPPKSKAPSS